MESDNKVTVLANCCVSPPPCTTSDKSLPLTFLDLRCVHWSPMENLIFYEYPNISKNHFIESIIPSLKRSLSLTLKYLYPFAGNLIFPPNSCKPEIRYLEGDSVSLIFAESSSDFDYLTGNQARKALEFWHLVPPLSAGSMSDDILVASIASFQVTLFPNSGISVGFNIRHVIGDAHVIFGFMRSWASITKAGGDDYDHGIASSSPNYLMPYYDRTRLRDPRGLEVENIVWNYLKTTKFELESQPPLPTDDKVRATFLMDRARVQQLKKLVIAQYPCIPHLSTFTVTCAYVWSCMAKARAASGEEEEEAGGEMESFIFKANFRSRMDPPLPPNYFGNCVAPLLARVKIAELKGSDGFVIAAKSIGEAIQMRLNHAVVEVSKGAEDWVLEMEELKGRIFGNSSSPVFKMYDVDFGWGRPKKFELILIDSSGTMGLSDGQNEGEMEIGLSFPKPIIAAFASIFTIGLQTLDCKVKQVAANNCMSKDLVLEIENFEYFELVAKTKSSYKLNKFNFCFIFFKVLFQFYHVTHRLSRIYTALVRVQISHKSK